MSSPDETFSDVIPAQGAPTQVSHTCAARRRGCPPSCRRRVSDTMRRGHDVALVVMWSTFARCASCLKSCDCKPMAGCRTTRGFRCCSIATPCLLWAATRRRRSRTCSGATAGRPSGATAFIPFTTITRTCTRCWVLPRATRGLCSAARVGTRSRSSGGCRPAAGGHRPFQPRGVARFSRGRSLSAQPVR